MTQRDLTTNYYRPLAERWLVLALATLRATAEQAAPAKEGE